jgi:archaellum component FlaC
MIEMPMINTHAIVKSLVVTGFTEGQAEAIADAVLAGHNIEDFVTKDQFDIIEKLLFDVKDDLDTLKNNFYELKSDVQLLDQRTNTGFQDLRQEMKTDIQAVRQEMKADMQVLRQEIKADMAVLKIDLIKWMLPFFIAILALMVSSLFK